MRIQSIGLSVVSMFILTACQSSDILPPRNLQSEISNTVENFAALDQNGKFHELYYYSDQKAIVVISQGNGCPIFQKSMAHLQRLKSTFESQGVVFLLINSNRLDDRQSIIKELKDFGLDMDVLQDQSQVIAHQLGIRRTAEAIVVDPQSWRVVYRGAMNDQLGYETVNAEIRNDYLRDAIESLVQRQPLNISRTEAKGCLIHFETPARTVTYTEHVVPILEKSCVPCHQAGGVAPWAMDSYGSVKSWGAMIREVLLTKRMPPWHADPAYGEFKNDVSLSPDELQTLMRWIEQGFLYGKGRDKLRERRSTIFEDWPLGQPDIIFSMPEEHSIANSGADDFQNIRMDIPIPEDLWVRAFDMRPSNARVVHHGNVVLHAPKSIEETGQDEGATDKSDQEDMFQSSGMGTDQGQIVMGYSPGSGPFLLPEETGIFIPKGTTLEFRMHYIPTGKPEKDRTRLGIYLHKNKPKHILSVATILDRSLNIPAGVKSYKIQRTHTFGNPVQLLALMPHMHYRGKGMKFTLRYPDETEEILLSVPNYKFNWQRQYVLEDPKIILPGGTILLEGEFDNSSQNPFNPNSLVNVPWGPKSSDEMFLGILYYVDSD